MFSRVPGGIREVDVSGEADRPITIIPEYAALTNEDGVIITTENGDEILIPISSTPVSVVPRFGFDMASDDDSVTFDRL